MPAPAHRGWFRRRSDGVRVSIKVTPRAARGGIKGVEIDARGDAYLAVRVAAPPENGKANAETVRLLARRLGVANRDLSVVHGMSGRRKVLHLRGAPETLSAKLEALV